MIDEGSGETEQADLRTHQSRKRKAAGVCKQDSPYDLPDIDWADWRRRVPEVRKFPEGWAFIFRGAFNAISRLSEEQRSRGVIGEKGALFLKVRDSPA